MLYDLFVWTLFLKYVETNFITMILRILYTFLILLFYSFAIHGQIPENDLCEDAILISCGDIVSGNTFEATEDNDQNICPFGFFQGEDLWYTIEGTDQVIEFSYISSDYDEIKFNVYSESCSSDCENEFEITAFNNGTNGFFAEDGQTYWLRVVPSCCQGLTGDFSFSVACSEAPLNDLCADATPLLCDTQVSQSTVALTLDNDYCLGSSSVVLHWYSLAGDDVVHAFTYITAPTSDFTLTIFEDSCPGDESNCAVESFYFWSSDPTHEFFAEAGKSYIIRVESSDCCRGELSFFHECIPVPENNDCEVAISLTCGDIVQASTNGATTATTNHECISDTRNDIWYSFNGNDQLAMLSLIQSNNNAQIQAEIFTVGCEMNETNCLIRTSDLENGELTFFAEIGTQYWLRLSTDGFYVSGADFIFSLSCADSEINDQCENAEPISCGQLLSGNLTNASPSFVDQNCISSSRIDVWYTLVGDGNLYEFTYFPSRSEQSLLIDFKDVSCSEEQNVCYNEFRFDQFSTDTIDYFLAQLGKVYLVQASYFRVEGDGSFEIEIQCIEPIVNDYCDAPLEISCGDTILFDDIIATTSNEFMNCIFTRQEELWYSLIGDDRVHIFSKLNSGSFDDTDFMFKEMDCGIQDPSCAPGFDLNRFNDFSNSFYAESGVDYLFSISSRFNGVDTIIHECVDLIQNDICLDAIEISCGQEITANSLHATNSIPDGSCFQTESQDVWYKITGDNKFYNFRYLESTNSEMRFEFYPDCTDFQSNYSCANVGAYVSINDSVSNNFYLDINQELYIRVTQCCMEGDFAFSVECEEPIEAEECMNAPLVNCGDTVIEDGTQGIIPSFQNLCIDANMLSYWYQVSGTGELFSIKNAGSSSLRITVFEGECFGAPYPEICLGTFDLYAQNNLANFTSDLNKTYWIQVINYEEEFELSFDCVEPLENDDCINAQPLPCNGSIDVSLTYATDSDNIPFCVNTNIPDLWYTIVGDNQFHEITLQDYTENESVVISLLQGECEVDETTCLNTFYLDQNDEFFRFFAEANSTYLLNIIHDCCVPVVDFSLDIVCAEPPINDDCVDAIEILCDQNSIVGSTNYTLGSDLILDCDPFFDDGVWYTFVGDNNFYLFDFISADEFRIELDIFSGACGSELVCDESLNLTASSQVDPFFAVDGVVYWLNVYVCCDGGNFEISKQCITPDGNDVCEMATPLACNEVIQVDALSATPTPNFVGCEQNTEADNDRWFSFVGDGMVKRFSYENSNVNIEIYTGVCGPESLICERSISLNSFDQFESVYAIPGITYYVRVITNTTDLTFRLDCVQSSINDLCENPVQITCGEEINGNTENASEQDESNGCQSERSPDLWYTIIGDGNAYTFDLLNNVNDLLFVSIYDSQCGPGEGALFEECLDTGIALQPGISTASFITEVGQTYYIRIYAGFRRPLGPFSFAVSCSVPAPNDNCDSPSPLQCGTTVIGSTEFASIDQGDLGCGFNSNNDVWYSITGNDEVLQFEYLSSQDHELIIIKVFEGDCEDVFEDTSGEVCVDVLLLDSTLVIDLFFAEVGVDYLFNVILAGDEGDFSFELDCVVPPSNDECTNPMTIVCGEQIPANAFYATPTSEIIGCEFGGQGLPDIWYEIIGDGNIYSFSIAGNGDYSGILEAYSSDCSDLNCEAGTFVSNNVSIASLDFDTEPNVTYYIRVAMSSEGNNLSLQLDCQEAEPNDLCSGAIPLECGAEYSPNTNFATALPNSSFCNSSVGQYVWYSVSGDDLIHYFHYQPTSVQSIEIEIFEGTCDQLSCVKSLSISSFSDGFFHAELNKEYLIRVFSFHSASFTFSTSCHAIASNDSCGSSQTISCPETVSGSFLGALPDSELNCSTSNSIGVWYEFVGDGNLHYFTLDPLIPDPQVEDDLQIYIIEGDCSNQSCTRYRELDFQGNINIITLEENVIYYFYLRSEGQFVDFEFSSFCVPNNECEMSTPLLCNSTVDGTTVSATPLNGPDCGNLTVGNETAWYSFTGTGDFVKLNVNSIATHLLTVFENSCDNLSCVETTFMDPVFMTDAATEYYIAVTNLDQGFQSDFVLSLTCDIIEITDPCSCNNDQDLNPEGIGSFSEIVSIVGTDSDETWTVISITNQDASLPPADIQNGDVLTFNPISGNHEISFTHFDNAGYSISIEGPHYIGHPDNYIAEISNLCSYPHLDLVEDQIVVNPIDSIYLADLISNENVGGSYQLIYNGQSYTDALAASDLDLQANEVILQYVSQDNCIAQASLVIIVFVDSSIPTAGEWGLLCLLLLLMIVGVNYITEQKLKSIELGSY